MFVAYEGNTEGSLRGCAKTKPITTSSAHQLQFQLSLNLIYVAEDCIYLCSNDLKSVDTGDTIQGALDNLVYEQLIRFPSDPDLMSSKESALEHQNDMCIPYLMSSFWPNRFLRKPAYANLKCEEDLATSPLIFAETRKPVPAKRQLFDGSLLVEKKRKLGHNE